MTERRHLRPLVTEMIKVMAEKLDTRVLVLHIHSAAMAVKSMGNQPSSTDTPSEEPLVAWQQVCIALAPTRS
jgi:hypothetical protein